MVKHSPCLCRLSLVSNAVYSDPPEALKPAHTCLSQASTVSPPGEYAEFSSSQLYHWEHFSASAPHVCHFLMYVCSFRNLSPSLCDLLSHSLEKKIPRTSSLLHTKRAPPPNSSAQTTSGFQECLLKFVTDAKVCWEHDWDENWESPWKSLFTSQGFGFFIS